MKVHVYGRVSKSNNKGYGGTNINIQFDESKEYCLLRGWTQNQIIYHVQERSARNGNNLPELNAILDIMEPGDILVIYTVDRLSRNTLEGIDFLERLTKKGCHIESVLERITYNADSIYDRFRFRDIINHAELESDRISVRTRRSHTHRKLARDGPALSSTRFQCRKRRRSEVDVSTTTQNNQMLDDHMDINGVATRSMINNSKRRRIEILDSDNENAEASDEAEEVIKISTRDKRVNKNNLLRNVLERYRS